MKSISRLGFIASCLVSCTNESMSLRHRVERTEKISEDASIVPPISFQLTRADLRPLSKLEIQHSLQDIFHLSAPPELENFMEQSSKSQIFRNSYDILNDSSSLAGLSRDITVLLETMDVRRLSLDLVQCDPLENSACRLRWAERVATHAWRRPLDANEKKILETQSLGISRLAPSVQSAALSQWIVQIIFDPRFLFRLELGSSPNPAAQYPLASWEKLATISYNLKQRPPSYEQIMSLASFEKDPKHFAKLIDEIMDSTALATALSDIISQWLMYYGLENMDIQGDPNWNKEKAKEQLVAAQQFIVRTLAQEDTLKALFTKPNSENEGYGIFSSRAFLTATSKNGHGSMIMRGVRIIRNALCQPMGVPPGTLEAAAPKDLSAADPNYDIKLTLMHGARADCAVCHRLIDPAGLALHTFDGFGVNMNAVVDFNALSIPSEVKVYLGGQTDYISTASPADFAESIAHSTSFSRCFSRNALRYVLGRDLTEGELMTADQMADRYLNPELSEQESLTQYFREIMNTETLYTRIR